MTRPAAIVVLALTASLLNGADRLAAAPDFSGTAIAAAPPAPLEGDVVVFTVTIPNRGDQDAANTQVQITLPREGMYLDATAFEGAAHDRDAGTLSGTVTVPAGGQTRLAFRVLVPRDAGGRMLSTTVKVSNLYLGAADQIEHGQVEIGTRLSTVGPVVGGIRLTPASLVLLAVIASYPLLWLLIGRRAGHGGVFALVIAIGFWTIFAAMAIRDYRSLTAWRETSCVIRDSRLRADSGSSTRRDRNRVQRPTGSDDTTYQPLLALEYTADGRPMVSTGFDTGSRLAIGGLGGAVEEFSRWPIGQSVPCWFDPAHPEDVVVIRGFGGAYFFALFPLPLFVFGIWAAARRRRPRGRR